MKKVLVKGPALSASGYGEQTRFALRSLRAHEDKFDIFLENISWGKTGWIPADDPDREWIDYLIGKCHFYKQNGGKFDISLQVTIPNEWDTSLAPYNVGFTAGIETTKIAPEWINPSNAMDKIIVVSNHAKYGLENTVYKGRNDQTGEVRDFKVLTPISVAHYPVKNIEPKELDINLEYDFNFLTVCQWGPRKNLEETVVSFVEEFKDEEVGLIVKTNIARNNTADRLVCERKFKEYLETVPDRKCKIYLIHGHMSDEEMTGLYIHPKVKAIVSTTHGEGFGLPLFEAAYNGLPIIAPNWSGQVDFLYAPVMDKKKNKLRRRPHFLKIDYDIKPVQAAARWPGVIVEDAMWAFPKRFSVKSQMREAFKNIQEREGIAKRLKKHLLEAFNQDDMYDNFVDSMYELDEEWEDELDQVAEA